MLKSIVRIFRTEMIEQKRQSGLFTYCDHLEYIFFMKTCYRRIKFFFQINLKYILDEAINLAVDTRNTVNNKVLSVRRIKSANVLPRPFEVYVQKRQLGTY